MNESNNPSETQDTIPTTTSIRSDEDIIAAGKWYEGTQTRTYELSNALAEEWEPIHQWFSLSYSSYMVLQRSLLQDMPREWQQRFMQCIWELEQTFDTDKIPTSNFMVRARDWDGKFIHDPLMNYRRPNVEFIEAIRKIPKVNDHDVE